MITLESTAGLGITVLPYGATWASCRVPMGDGTNSLAFDAACDLVFKGREQPSGYTEPLLHAYRLKFKDQHGVA